LCKERQWKGKGGGGGTLMVEQERIDKFGIVSGIRRKKKGKAGKQAG